MWCFIFCWTLVSCALFSRGNHCGSCCIMAVLFGPAALVTDKTHSTSLAILQVAVGTESTDEESSHTLWEQFRLTDADRHLVCLQIKIFCFLLFSLFAEGVYLLHLDLLCNCTSWSNHVHAVDYKMTKKLSLVEKEFPLKHVITVYLKNPGCTSVLFVYFYCLCSIGCAATVKTRKT